MIAWYGVPLTVEDLIHSKKTIIVLGAGGVGKTSTSAALAVISAMSGKKVLCLTIDPAKRLANSLGLDALPNEGQLISSQFFQEQGLECSGQLYALVLDKKKTFDDLLKRHTKDPKNLDRILNNRLYRYISTSLAGTHEYMAMEKLHAVLEEEDYDLVIVDTPPASDVFGFFDAPDRVVEAIDSQATRWMVQALSTSGRLSLGLLSKGAAVLLAALSKITGAKFMQEIGEFLLDFNSLFGGFRHRAMMVKGMLQRSDFGYLTVTSTSPPALFELREVQRRLTERGLHPEATVFNRVQLPPAPYDSDELQSAYRELEKNHAGINVLQGKLQEAYDDEVHRAQIDEALLSSEKKHAMPKGTLLVRVPLMEEDVHDLAGLAKLGEALLKV
ncbi:MAG: ArsA family ATPase [Myxococcales bacterium]|nr:MAG: ArsA family ATPase [Myxococcales bacterium]